MATSAPIALTDCVAEGSACRCRPPSPPSDLPTPTPTRGQPQPMRPPPFAPSAMTHPGSHRHPPLPLPPVPSFGCRQGAPSVAKVKSGPSGGGARQGVPPPGHGPEKRPSEMCPCPHRPTGDGGGEEGGLPSAVGKYKRQRRAAAYLRVLTPPPPLCPSTPSTPVLPRYPPPPPQRGLPARRRQSPPPPMAVNKNVLTRKSASNGRFRDPPLSNLTLRGGGVGRVGNNIMYTLY